MTMNRLQCDIQLQGCQLGHVLPEHPKTTWPVAEDTVRSPDVSACKSALYDGRVDGFHVPSVDGTMKIASPPARRGDALDLWRLTTRPLGEKYVRADNAYVARCCLGPCRGPQRQQTPCCRVRPGERGAPRRSGGCALGSLGQRLHAGVARRPLVVVSMSSGRRAGHVPSPDEVRGRDLASRFSGLQDVPSACQQVQRVLLFGFLPGRAQTLSRRTETGSSPVTRCSSTTICVARHCPRAHRCRSHQHEECRGLVGACRADPGPGGCRDFVPEEMKNKHSQREKSRLGLLMVAATFQRYQW